MMPANDHVPSKAQDSFVGLKHALCNADFSTARRITSELATATSASLDDALALIAHHAKTKPQAVELLVELLDASGTVRRFAGAALLDHTAVDDVGQDALISIADSIDTYNGSSKVTTWVHSIVRRRVVDHLRRQRATVPLDDGDISPAARMSSIIATRATVRDALESLPEIYQTPVVLRDIEGHSYAEIAELLNRAQGTIKAQIARGRAMVAARLRSTGDAE
ncbi:MAG TPA: RNA polymerase sigma factor [Candidatus Yaniella excrementigallinarum]|nr:RNA polymerase sigma factor [Candidatus Yaniella excrementigallinarum]